MEFVASTRTELPESRIHNGVENSFLQSKVYSFQRNTHCYWSWWQLFTRTGEYTEYVWETYGIYMGADGTTHTLWKWGANVQVDFPSFQDRLDLGHSSQHEILTVIYLYFIRPSKSNYLLLESNISYLHVVSLFFHFQRKLEWEGNIHSGWRRHGISCHVKIFCRQLYVCTCANIRLQQIVDKIINRIDECRL